MQVELTVGLLIGAVVANGVLAGASLDQSIKQLPARRRIGVVAFAAYSQAAALTNGIAWYATLGVGTGLLSLAAAIAGLGDDPGTQRLVALALAAGLTLAHSLVTARAAPANFAQRRMGTDERALGQLFDRSSGYRTSAPSFRSPPSGPACGRGWPPSPPTPDEDRATQAPTPTGKETAMTEVRDVRQTTCCVVGAGPAGAMLALLLARQNIPVVLLEAHGDFDRDFRGDSLHPAILEVLDELGLADRLLAELPHRKIYQATLPTGAPAVIDFARLRHRTRFPFMTLMPQAQFLEFLTAEAARSPCFKLVRRANVRELLVDGDAVRGVRYRAPDGWHELRALLTVGADGRFSQVRRQSGLQARTTASAIDVLWLRLPRLHTDPEGILGRVGHGTMLLLADRGQLWQLGMIIPKGSFPALRDAGLESLQRTIVELVPWLTDRVGHLRAWSQASLLSVQADRLVRWWRPGLLLIGDAAHVMSPVAGNGINYAVADAVATANLLSDPLAAGTLPDRDLMAVQRRRDWPTRITQTAVGLLQDRMLAQALRWQAGPPPAVAVLLRVLLGIPRLADLPLRVAAFGLRPEHVASNTQANAQVRDRRDP